MTVLCSICSSYSCKDAHAPTSSDGIEPEIKVASSGIIFQPSDDLKYDVSKYEKYTLPSKLVEISGLTIDAERNELYAVNDEKAILFKLSLDGEILEEVDFGKNADYEGLEKVDDAVYILKSNGKIVEYDTRTSKSIDTYDNPLSLSNDAEGLGYDHKTNSLLIACKGSPNIKSAPKLKKTKSVYSFNLDTKEFNNTPFITVSDESLKRYLEENLSSKLSKKKRKKLLNRAADFSPSAMAAHPDEDHFYILSSAGKSLVVVDRKAVIKDIYFLDDSAYIQPEGICFDSESNMYISNEGKSLRSNIVKINYMK